jgi:hypothetical protein
MKSSMLAIFVILLCACATSYQPKTFTGGFSETRLAENIFQVSFRGNAYTDMERATDFTLLRSAEIALENGFRYFAIVDSQAWEKTGIVTTPVQTHTNIQANTLGTYGNQGSYSASTMGTATTYTTGGQSYVVSKPHTNNTIVCFTDQPADGTFVFDAMFVSNSVKAKYKLP